MEVNNPIPLDYILTANDKKIKALDVDVPPWNMDMMISRSISFTLPSNALPVGAIITVWDDDGPELGNKYLVPYYNSINGLIDLWTPQISVDTISMVRRNAGFFDDPAFNDTGINRGAGILFYIEDFF